MSEQETTCKKDYSTSFGSILPSWCVKLDSILKKTRAGATTCAAPAGDIVHSSINNLGVEDNGKNK